MAENVLSQMAIPSAGLAELKAAFEKALEERKAVDVRIEEIRKAIGSRLQEAQSLNDAANNLSDAVLPKKTDQNTTFNVNISTVWQFFLKFILPALIMLGVLWFAFGQKKTTDAVGCAEHFGTEVTVHSSESHEWLR